MSIESLQSIVTIGPGPQNPAPRPRKDPLVFRSLLAETLRSAAGDSPPATASPSREQWMGIVHQVTVQMDSALMKAFSAGGRAEIDSGYPALAEWSPSPAPDSSNKRQEDQNIDTSEPRSRIDMAIADAARIHGVDPDLVRSVIQAESGFDPNCTSPKGAMGLMQLMPETARELGVRNGYDPVENIEAGTRYLKTLLNRYQGDVRLALSAYNWGMGNLERRPEQMPSETRRYVDRVTRQYATLKA